MSVFLSNYHYRIKDSHSKKHARMRSLLEGVAGSFWSVASLLFGLVFVQLHELGQIELGLLQDLDLADHAVVLEWVDFAALSLDLFADFFFNENLHELLQSRLLNG